MKVGQRAMSGIGSAPGSAMREEERGMKRGGATRKEGARLCPPPRGRKLMASLAAGTGGRTKEGGGGRPFSGPLLRPRSRKSCARSKSADLRDPETVEIPGPSISYKEFNLGEHRLSG